MKSDLIKRLVAAIAMESQPDLDKLADTIVDDQKRRGHNKLAEELERILETTSPVAPKAKPKRRDNRLVSSR